LAPASVGGQAEPDLDEVTIDLEMPFPENPEAIENILQVIEENSLDIRESADRLTAFTEQPGEYSRLTHSWRINRIQEGLPEIHEALARLDAGQNLLLDGQKSALEIIRSAAGELTGSVRTLNDHVEQNPEWNVEYIELVQAVRDSADKIVQAAGLAESLSEVRTYLEGIEAEN
jgi:hypothetical protein